MSQRHSDSNDKSDPLASRAAALTLLSGAVREGKAIDKRFQKIAGQLEPRDRAFVRHLVATTLRRLGQIDAVLKTFTTRAPPAQVEDILRLGTAQILFLETAPHAAVDTSVGLVKRVRQPRLTGLVNAVLRKVAATGQDIVADQNWPRLNTPGWLWDGWTKAYGETTAHRMGEAHLAAAPLDLTVKDPASSEKWAKDLEAELLPTGSLRHTASGMIQDLPGFAEGAWWVQDAAAAMPARILLQATATSTDSRVADLCSAPGGKTLQLAAAGRQVTSMDSSETRLTRVQENLDRMSLKAEIVHADMMRWTPPQLFNAVLLDAPCSATGTLRRHPDLGYLKKRRDVLAYPETQKALLKRAAEFLTPGGVLVYAVCSLEPEEGQGVVDAVLKDAGLSRQPIDPAPLGLDSNWIDSAGALRTLPYYWHHRGGLDGFYAAVLKKNG
ncbi:MAG: RsmB/NOP family class I SAM-dependent RNA methyltransferase [Rhodospirillaceae bacterium]|jgi:16S rRNA (cytosine967-C5)-methyltransferase|nr:RsmB/NOP family class I SAM-dependent RNA methyltransferase [Rhodospirillaceae bacterium]MBT5240545.1 RsmB/NOP family class I SAM-dependent RNA methyltransferase [Rhodospirillaceae bacterium]MBT5564891.1 RsmB/NOP family class I SAM-dependent RNA methyltransferase [Rhodospirillaceae bacterium]MBT6090569.1 RsmB/NOP family class I SAM-dependent RNA methyltransferase [Rhodospirillaceae bacterium]MBT6961326.1 RsmB/NOP family class I SAM-dependent RNA methyltransferase [Rhodospirillaceae bacterium